LSLKFVNASCSVACRQSSTDENGGGISGSGFYRLQLSVTNGGQIPILKGNNSIASISGAFYLSMSIQITARIVCDDCGAIVSGKIETRSTYAKSAYWSAINEARRRNWMPLAHGRYGTRIHYCQICAGKHTANKWAGKLKNTAMDFSK
jgi:hypothetical protein